MAEYEFVGTHQIPQLAADENVATVMYTHTLAAAVNNAVGTVAAEVEALGPAWAPERSVPADADLDAYLLPGVHRIRTPDTATIVNLPPGMRTSGVLENVITGDGSDVIRVQRVTEQGDNARSWWRDPSSDTRIWAEAAHPAQAVSEWHVFLAAGQSNMSGRGSVGVAAGGRYYNERIAQYGNAGRTIALATVPLDMHDNASGLSPATAFARNYLRNQPENVGVLLIPAAHGGTGFTTSTGNYTWTPNIATQEQFNLPWNAVTQTQEGITAAASAGYLVTLKGILWHQGENNGSMSTATYAANLDTLIAYLRDELGDAKLPFIVGQMVPEGIDLSTGRQGVDLAHRQTPGRVPYTGFAPATRGGHNDGDTTHMSQRGVDYIGRTYLEAYERATASTVSVVEVAQLTNTATSAATTATGAAADAEDDRARAEAAANWASSPGYQLNTSVGTRVSIGGIDIFYDTGWRNLASLFPPEVDKSISYFRIRRTLREIHVAAEVAYLAGSGSGAITMMQLPDGGFRPFVDSSSSAGRPAIIALNGTNLIHYVGLSRAGSFAWMFSENAGVLGTARPVGSSQSVVINATYAAPEALPTSLIGTPV